MITTSLLRKPILFVKSMPLVAVIAGFGTACMQLPDNTATLAANSASPSKSQEDLLAELEANRARWAEANAQGYSFEVTRDCDACPEELPTAILVSVGDAGGDGSAPKSKVSARDGSDSDNRRIQSFSDGRVNSFGDGRVSSFGDGSINSMESYFANVRQGILSNQIRNVNYDPTYGFPQQIVVGNSFNPNLDAYRFSTNNFRVNNNVQLPASSVWTGAFNNGGVVNGAGAYWLVEDTGAWNQLQMPQALAGQFGSLNNGARVQVAGQWMPGGLNGQGVINVNNLTALQQQANAGIVNGWLTSGYNVNPTAGSVPGNAYSYSVVGADGRVVPVNFPSNLSTQALNWVGNPVSLNGSYQTANPYGIQTFQANQALAFPQTPVQLTGSLAWSGGAYPNVAGQSQVWLVDDVGKWNELRVPANLNSVISGYSQGTRVRVNGVYGMSASGSPLIDVLDFGQLNNVFTDILLAGLLDDDSSLQFGVQDGFNSRFILASDNGTRYQLRVPNSLSNANSLRRGARVQVTGGWAPGGVNGLGIVDARYLQVLNNNTSDVTLGGLILGRDYNNSAIQMYSFQVDDGRVYRLRVPSTTSVIQQGVILNIGVRVQVVGQLWVDVNELVAQQIRPFSPYTNSMTLTGTMVNWGNVGSLSNSLILSDDNGRVWHVVFQAALAPNIYPGARLSITGMADVSAGHFDASSIQVISNAVASPYVPYVPPFAVQYPVNYNTPVVAPGMFQTLVEGTFIRANPSITTMGVFEFRGNDGRTYTVSYQSPGTPILPTQVAFSAGMRLRVSGYTDGGTGIQANSIEVLSTTGAISGTLPYVQANTVTGTMTRWVLSANVANVIEIMDDTGRTLQVGFNDPGVSYVPQRMQLAPGMRLRVSTYGASPITGPGSVFNATVIEILSPISGLGGFGGLGGVGSVGLGNLAVFNVTITGIGSIGSSYGGVGPIYTYSATDDNGRALTLRVTGQTLSTAIFGTSLTPGSRVRVTGLYSGSTITNEVDVQRIESIY